MKKKVLISLGLVATLIFAATLIALGFESGKQNGGLAKTYVYEKGGFGSDFTLTLNEDGTFTYYAGMLSSYIGYGKWSVQGNILTITETNEHVNRFRIDGGDLVFISEGSKNFMYVKVGDGERFNASEKAPCGQTEDPADTKMDQNAKLYKYEKGGFGSDFSLTLNEDGTFTYYAGMLSSYIGFGKWSVQGNILTITETNGHINRFRIDGDDLVFISEGSENFMYVKVGDGERFIACPVVPSDTSDAE